MARHLAAMGFVVLRFDFSGIGDSPVRADHLPFKKSAVSETQEAMDFLQTTRDMKRFVLTGICSGAVISFKTACCDPRVVGALLINARGHLHGTDDEAGSAIKNRALARHYWRIGFSSSFRAKNWWKALTGKVDYQGLIRVLLSFRLRNRFKRNKKASSGIESGMTDLRLLIDRGVRLLHVYAEGDEGLDYFQVLCGDGLQQGLAGEPLRVEIIHGANHVFTSLWSQEQLLKIVHSWAQMLVQSRSGIDYLSISQEDRAPTPLPQDYKP